MIRKVVDVLARGARQFAQISYSERRRFPTRQGFVNGLDAAKILRHSGKGIALLSVKVVTNANLNFIERIEHVEFGQRNGSEAVNLSRVARRERVEPSAPPRTSCG